MSADYTCGDFLDDCRCLYRGAVALSPAGMQLRHEASLKRAERSSTGVTAPSIQEAAEAENAAQRPNEHALRPQQRAQAGHASLDETVVAVIRKVRRAAA